MTLEEFKKQINYTSIAYKTIIKKNGPNVHILASHLDNRVVVCSVWTETINSLLDVSSNCFVRHSINFDETNNSQNINCLEPYLFYCQRENYVKKEKEFTFNELYYYNLMIEKGAALDTMNGNINHYRRTVLNAIVYQDVIYDLKYREAKEIIEKNIDLDEDNNWPFVSDYAKIMNVDLQTASKEIVLQHKFFKSFLLNTERLRIKFKKIIQDCSDITKIKSIVSQFKSESIIYAKL